ncbi:MAG TPA: hypothetical protein VHA80_08190 [Solirubrobacterales bacterium]|nr:hypothetical protein [Solirubrobacterales bacterium]
MDEIPPQDLPAEIDLGRHRDFQGRVAGQWLRRGFLFLLLLFVVAALANAFGQADATDTASGAAGSLSVKAPSRVRGGLHYQAEFQLHAKRALAAPTLVLQRGWIDQTAMNTLEPEPAGTTTDAAGDLKWRFPAMAAGRTLVVYAQFESNPLNVGSHEAGVALYDGATPIATISRSQFNFP